MQQRRTGSLCLDAIHRILCGSPPALDTDGGEGDGRDRSEGEREEPPVDGCALGEGLEPLGAEVVGIEIPEGAIIDNQTPIGYLQFYAQLLHEVNAGERYWLTEEETASLQRANVRYQSTLDMERMVDTCFRHPAADEPCRPLPMSDIVDIVARQFPFVRPTQGTKVQLGLALTAHGFKQTRDKEARYYYVVPL